MKPFPKYFVFTEDELLFLVICILLDVSEYIVAVLLIPIVGDVLDIVGFIICVAMFHWFGFLSLLELVPGLDIFPIFIITWLTWFYAKKRRKRMTYA